MVEDNSIIDTLRTKLSDGKLFANCGPVLITLNPYEATSVYDGTVASFYHVERECGPKNVLSARSHVFSISRVMRQLLVLHEGPQVAIFMGYSGSGKSYAVDTLVRQSIRAFPIARTKPFSLTEPASLPDRVVKAIALIRKTISASACRSTTSTRAVLEIGLRFKLPNAASENRAGTLVGANFSIYGLERWRAALRRPTCAEDAPFFLLNEVIAALVCKGFGNEAQRVIENAWKAEEKEFLSALGRAMLGNENAEAVREWGVSFETTVHSLFSFGMANVQIAHLFRALSAVLLLSNVDFNTAGGITPLNLCAQNMSRGPDWRDTCTHAQWPEDLGAGVKCTLDEKPRDVDSIIDAEASRKQKVKALLKKSTRSKADSTHGLQVAAEKNIFSNVLAFSLPCAARIGMSEDMLDVAAHQAGFQGLPSESDLRGKLLDRLTMCSDRSWLNSNGNQVNVTIIDFVADLLELESTDLYTALTQPTGKEKSVNVGTVQSRCDALASSLYAGTVNTIIDAINLNFECDTKNTNVMSVIDTPGFEDPATATFSQFYRNLTAELFNSFYVSKTFTKFEKHCRDENIECPPADYTKISTQVLDVVFGMLHLKVDNIMTILESVNLTSAPSTRYEWTREILSNLTDLTRQDIWTTEEDSHAWETWNAIMHKKEKNIIKKDKKLFKDAEVACRRFCVQHYSTKVTYSVETWVDTNRGVMNAALIEVVGTSSSSLVRRVAESAGSKSLLGEFQEFERTLLAKLGSTQSHFIQCIRPNNHQKPGEFDTALVAEQVRAIQLGPLGKIYSLGFHYYYGLAEFITKYKDLLTGTIPPHASDAFICGQIVEAAGISDTSRVNKGVLINHRARGRLVESLMKNYRQVSVSSSRNAAPSNAPRSNAPRIVPRSANSLGMGAASTSTVDDEDMYLDVNDINPRGGKKKEAAPAPPTRQPAVSETFDDDDVYLDVSQIAKAQQQQQQEDEVSMSEDAGQDDMYLDLSEVQAQSWKQPLAASEPGRSGAATMPAADDDDMYLDLSSVTSAASGGGLQQAGGGDDVYLDLQDMNVAPPVSTNKVAERSKSDSGHRQSLTSQDGQSPACKMPGMPSPSPIRRNTDASAVGRMPPRLPPKVNNGPPPALPPSTPESRGLGRSSRSLSEDVIPPSALAMAQRTRFSGGPPIAEPSASVPGGPILPATPTESWYHGVMERNEAVQRLKVHGGDCFLVRGSTTREGSYTLSFVHMGQVNHFKISVMKTGAVRMPGNKEQFDSLAELVTYHQQVPLSKDGKLLHKPVSK